MSGKKRPAENAMDDSNKRIESVDAPAAADVNDTDGNNHVENEDSYMNQDSNNGSGTMNMNVNVLDFNSEEDDIATSALLALADHNVQVSSIGHEPDDSSELSPSAMNSTSQQDDNDGCTTTSDTSSAQFHENTGERRIWLRAPNVPSDGQPRRPRIGNGFQAELPPVPLSK